jgi:hypothetical protein
MAIEKIRNKQVSEIDWAKLAVALDGEGCITIRVDRPERTYRVTEQYYVHLSLSNTDPRLPMWCHKTTGEGHFYAVPPRSARHKTQYLWVVAINGASAWILRNCLPHFIIKREQAEICLALRETKNWKHGKGTGRFTPESVRFERANLKAKLHALKKGQTPYIVEVAS